MQGGSKERFDISHLSDGITVNDLEQVHFVYMYIVYWKET